MVCRRRRSSSRDRPGPACQCRAKHCESPGLALGCCEARAGELAAERGIAASPGARGIARLEPLPMLPYEGIARPSGGDVYLTLSHAVLMPNRVARENRTRGPRPVVAGGQVGGVVLTGARRSCAAPSNEQATKERERVRAEVELRAGSTTPSTGSVEQQDKDPPVLDVEQIQVILGGGPMVTP
ncbi:hypothetical protein NDU88_007664 [Pleurodeles waltl]|uniref:Uncharacterized protein n=1 Tax=Pleurodeles waltl TaxID=8319 RepID=A0AAV7PM28_PLEWA|nr:hypothetical protein NDU88_007664 [Pleurodeles waltl]